MCKSLTPNLCAPNLMMTKGAALHGGYYDEVQMRPLPHPNDVMLALYVYQGHSRKTGRGIEMDLFYKSS
jgi:hypothetical protein